MTAKEAIASLKTLCHTCEMFPKCVNDKPECFQAIELAISALQAQEANHSTESSLTQKALDTISRQAAIDLCDWYDNPSMHDDLEKLPSAQPEVLACGEGVLTAQPEIVRCKDCKHHWTHRCMDSMPTEICELDQTFYDANVDFCSLAERRTDEPDK